MSMLCDLRQTLQNFFTQITSALGFDLLFAIAIALEVFFVLLFVIKTIYSYEMRLRRAVDKANNWLFVNKKITQDNIKEFNAIVKKGPKRLVYFWQQYILYREKEPSAYLSSENLIEKPLKTSSFKNNITNLSIFTIIWSVVCLLLGVSFQAAKTGSELRMLELICPLALCVVVLFIGYVSVMILKARKTSNLDELYHIYHIFARFVDNACVDLPPYIDFDLLFTPKEIEKGNPQLREYYEARARKAKEEFEKAKQSDVEYVEYNFKDAGIDGSLVLERAMKESETFMNKKSNTLAKIAHVEAQQEALKRNYENVQKDLQKKIQASKENIQKLIQQQEATTNRMEVGFLRKQQEQEISKQEALQNEYDQEETRFAVSNEELLQEIRNLNSELDNAKENVQRAMVAEYQSFYEKIMNGAYAMAEDRVLKEKNQLQKQRDDADKELTIVQTQVKRLIDENQTLRAKLAETAPEQMAQPQEEQPQGQYDDAGNYVYEDGSYHDPNGLFHDIDGKIYDKNGTLISEPESKEPAVAEPAEEQANEPEQAAAETKVEGEKRSGKEPKQRKKKSTKIKVEEVTPEELGLVEQPQQPQQAEQQPEQVETPVVTEVKRGRGRPRKPVTDTEPKVPRKRGRPRKTESTYETEKPVVASEKDGVPKVAPKKKRPASRVRKKPESAEPAAQQDTAKEQKPEPAAKESAKPAPKTTKKAAEKQAGKKTADAKKQADKKADKAENKPAAKKTDETKKEKETKKEVKKEQETSAPKPKKAAAQPTAQQTTKAATKAVKEKDSKAAEDTKQPTQTKAKAAAKKQTEKAKTPKAAPKTAKKADDNTQKATNAAKTEGQTKQSKAPAKKPKTTSSAKASASVATLTAPVSVTRTKKSDQIDLVSLAKINRLITEEEKRLSNMKALVNNEISDALNSNAEKELQDQREEVMKTVEELKQKAEKAKREGKNEQELSLINSRLEALINEITDLNGK